MIRRRQNTILKAMRKSMGYVVTILAIIMVAGESENCLAQKKTTPSPAKAPVRSTPLPASFEALYPPKAANPVFLLGMFEMNKSLTGIVVDLFEGDRDNAKANFEKFKAQYLATSKLVPEWQKEYYPLKPVEELGTSLQTNDRDQVMAAIGNIGMVCHNCHTANMVKVQQKYHWPDFKIIAVLDPLTKAWTTRRSCNISTRTSPESVLTSNKAKSKMHGNNSRDSTRGSRP